MSDATFEHAALAAVHRLSRAITETHDLQRICALLLEEAVRLIPVEHASLMQYDASAGGLRVVAARGMPAHVVERVLVQPGEGISGRVFSERTPQLVTDARNTREATRRRRYRGHSFLVAPVAAVPLHVRGQSLGVINLTDKCDGTPFSARDLTVLTTLANQAAAYLHLCALAEQQVQARAVERELEVARQIQQSFLPTMPLRLSGVDVGGICLPAARVGGDYFDVVRGDDGTVNVVIADVAGHNVAAALSMAAVRAVLRAELTIPGHDVATVLQRTNQALYADLARAEQFVSCAVLRFDPDSRLIHYCVAGHPPPLWCRMAATRAVPLLQGGTVLGAERTLALQVGHVPVRRGDCLFLYTDGLTGLRGARGRYFGTRRLAAAIRAAGTASASEMIRRVQHTVAQFAPRSLQQDDITMVALKIRA
ncbi:MAG: SpoIIE family protein phosphatase [Deltaproteobacteria bacterium]|nr:SpoIIE family protein phosphatase [Deltaproteobacteria bacterium]